MKTFIILATCTLLALSGCATKPIAGCTGEARRVNPPSATNAAAATAAIKPISCPWSHA